MNNVQESTSNFLLKLEASNKIKLSGSSDTLVLCAYLDEEEIEDKDEEEIEDKDEEEIENKNKEEIKKENKEENKKEKISYFSFENHRSKSCILL